MTIFQTGKLQSLQDAYASLCNLTLLTVSEDGEAVTEPSGGSLLSEFMLKEAPRFLQHAAALSSPIVYESEQGMKMILAPVRGLLLRSYFVMAGVWRDAGRSLEAANGQAGPASLGPSGELAAAGVPFFSSDEAGNAMKQITLFADMVLCLLEHEYKDKKQAERLQLLRMLSLLQQDNPEWLPSVLHIFVNVCGLEFAGFAAKAAGEQYAVTAVSGEAPGGEKLLGAGFYTGEGLLGHVALTQTMGYWEELDRDPRSAFFSDKGLSVQMMICYPIKYGEHMHGLLFGGSAAAAAMSEETADLGGILARQLASDIHNGAAQMKLDKARQSDRTLTEMAQALADVVADDKALSMAAEMIFRNTGAAMVAVLAEDKDMQGLDSQAGRLLGTFALRASSGSQQAHAFKPRISQWLGLELVEVSLTVRGEKLGVLAAAFEKEADTKSHLSFVQMAGHLLVQRLYRAAGELASELRLVPVGTDSYRKEEAPILREAVWPGEVLEEPAEASGAAEHLSWRDWLEGSLTPRESEVLELVIQGLSNTQIAQRLYISAHTVKNHMTKIYEKLGVTDRTQALAKCLQSSIGSISC